MQDKLQNIGLGSALDYLMGSLRAAVLDRLGNKTPVEAGAVKSACLGLSLLSGFGLDHIFPMRNRSVFWFTA